MNDYLHFNKKQFKLTNKNNTLTFVFFFQLYSQQWLLDRQDLVRERHADLKIMNEDEYEKCMIFFANCEFR